MARKSCGIPKNATFFDECVGWSRNLKHVSLQSCPCLLECTTEARAKAPVRDSQRRLCRTGEGLKAPCLDALIDDDIRLILLVALVVSLFALLVLGDFCVPVEGPIQGRGFFRGLRAPASLRGPLTCRFLLFLAHHQHGSEIRRCQEARLVLEPLLPALRVLQVFRDLRALRAHLLLLLQQVFDFLAHAAGSARARRAGRERAQH